MANSRIRGPGPEDTARWVFDLNLETTLLNKPFFSGCVFVVLMPPPTHRGDLDRLGYRPSNPSCRNHACSRAAKRENAFRLRNGRNRFTIDTLSVCCLPERLAGCSPA